MRAITFDGNIVSEAKDIADASTTSENTIKIALSAPTVRAERLAVQLMCASAGGIPYIPFQGNELSHAPLPSILI